eukprot:TRINITY_DN27143_c0_g1_i1.p1 TRINITY_DN27143_c0_g1~~TRINITY_DN27143_c0_g1_i1.p1  ORF type:complete len:357 (+),score=50.68 TRINITY_DN27143_c0_g1_i1:170-1240(+)
MRPAALAIACSAVLLLQSLLVPGVDAITNRDEVRREKEENCSAVIYGDEIDHGDIYHGVLAGVVDIFGGGGGAMTTAFLQEKLKKLVDAVGIDVVRKLIVDGENMTLDEGELTGGILTYSHKGWSYKCCAWLGNWSISACCCKRCGKFTWPMPNTYQPYLCWKIRDDHVFLSSPNKTAIAFHADCDSVSKARSPACVAAFHRFCESEGFEAGFASDWGSDHFGVTCAHPAAYKTIKVAELALLNPACSLTQSQTSPCLSAARRYCQGLLEEVTAGGIVQEVGTDSFGVACLDDATAWLFKDIEACQHHVPTFRCFPESRFYCQNETGESGALPQEYFGQTTHIMCFPRSYYLLPLK